MDATGTRAPRPMCTSSSSPVEVSTYTVLRPTPRRRATSEIASISRSDSLPAADATRRARSRSLQALCREPHETREKRSSRGESQRVDLLLGNPRRVRPGRSYAVLVDRRLVTHDVGGGVPRGHRVQHRSHENACASNARLPVRNCRVVRDQLEAVLRPASRRCARPAPDSDRVGRSLRPVHRVCTRRLETAPRWRFMYYDIPVWRSTDRRDDTGLAMWTFATPPILRSPSWISTKMLTLRESLQSDPTGPGTCSR